MSKGSRHNRFVGLRFWNVGGRRYNNNRDYDDVSLSGEPLLQRQSDDDSSVSVAAAPSPERLCKGTTESASSVIIHHPLPKSNTIGISSTSSGEGIEEGVQKVELKLPSLVTPSSPSPTDTCTTTQNNAKVIMLYDPNSMLELSSSLCQGYVTLLCSGNGPAQPEQAKGSKNTATNTANSTNNHTSNNNHNIELAYAAITDGNVIDVCFGIVSYSSSTKAPLNIMQKIKDVKEMISNLVENVDDNDCCDNELILQTLIVHTYCTSFQIIIHMNDRIQKLNFISKCLYCKRIRQQTIQQLQNNFIPLQQKVA